MSQEDDYVGLVDIAGMLGHTKQSVYRMRSRGQLPTPDAVTNNGYTPLFRRSTVTKWAAKTGRTIKYPDWRPDGEHAA